jgi:hypothetical protein
VQNLTTMVQQYLEVLHDPESFFERGEEAGSVLVPVVVLLFVGATSGVIAWLNFQRTSEMISRMGDGAAGGAGFAAIGGAVSVVVALVVPFIAWLVYAGLFHGLSALMDGEGEFTTTMVYTGWGFLPKILGSSVALAANWYIMQTVSLPAEITQQSVQAYQQQIQSHPATLGALAVGILVLLWSAYIWVAAVQHARDIDRADAAIAVGIPVALALLLRVGSQFLL